jgi:hypothetical protein
MSRSTAQPSLSARLSKLALPIAVIAITAGATNAFGGSPSLVAIPLLGTAANNQGLAITPDGRWVVGISDDGTYLPYNSTPGFLYNVSLGTASSAFNGAQILNPVSGVCYRTNGSQQEIIVGGLAAGWDSSLMTTNGTGFSSVVRYTYDGSGQRPVQGPVNMRAAGGGDSFFDVWWDVQSLGQVFIGKFSGPWPATLTPTPDLWDTYSVGINGNVQINGISGTGRAVGYWDSASSVFDWTGTGTATLWQFTTLDGSTVGQAFSISADGTIIFGRSTVSDFFTRPGTWPFKATFDGTMPGPATQLGINELPSFPDTVGSTGSAGVPYGCTADGEYAVGMSYRYAERAVLWDTSDPNSAKWTVLDLMDFATAQGIAGDFTDLGRAYSVGVTAGGDIIITGIGTANGYTRAFVMTVPKPLSAYSVYPPTVSISNNPAKYTFSFNSILSSPSSGVSLTNYLDYATALSNPPTPSTWSTLTAAQCNGGLTILVDPNPPDPQRFYRIRTQ